MAQLVPGETVQVQNHITGRLFAARVQVGGWGAVIVHPDGDSGLCAGDALLLIAGEQLSEVIPPPGTCTYCYAEDNQIVEIRDALSINCYTPPKGPASIQP